MRFKNKLNINLFDNPLRQDPNLLDKKNLLEAAWYDEEAQQFQEQLDQANGLMPIDRDFEKWFAQYYDNDTKKHPFDRDYAFFSLFPKSGDLKILELGSGNGCLSRFFIRRGFEVSSIDVSGAYCNFLKRSEPRSNPIRSCAEILPFKDNSFDIVTAFVALHHFNLDLCLPEIKRILTVGGRGIFIEPLGNSRFLYKLRQYIPVADNESPGGGGLIARDFRRKLDFLGFDYHITEHELITRLERLPWMRKLQPALRKTDFLILSNFPLLRHYARTVVIEIIRSR
jgi:SAM-dependent methyltransferase